MLYGRGLISTTEYHAGRDLADLIELAGKVLGGSVQISWLAIMGVRGIGNAGGFDAAAERAARVLDRLRRRLHPEIAKLTFAVAEGKWLPFLTLVLRGEVPVVVISRLQIGLGQVARAWSRGRVLTKTLDETQGANYQHA